jgi:calcineurin-like phosphoesterase
MEIIWGFIVGFAVTWLVLKLIAGYLRAKNEILKKELDELNKSIKEKFIHVNIEKHGNLFYLFEKDTDRFIAQGANMDELKSHCDARFKRSVIFANDDDLKSAGLI